MENKKIKTALISVYNKDGLEELVKLLHKLGVKIISTGGTAEFIKKQKIPVAEVESLTGFPSVFGGRIKTLHPKIFGGVLNRRANIGDQKEKTKHGIEDIDLVAVDLYPFEETLSSGASEEEIIEKIDIGGVTLLRAAAKNFQDVVVLSSKNDIITFCKILECSGAETTLEERKKFAGNAFAITSHYDTAIRSYFQGMQLRYGENPHQSASFVGNLAESFEQLHGKELSYNNLMDIEAAIKLVYDFEEPAFAIIKHMNACGLAVDEKLINAYKRAYAADLVSAFGGILAANGEVGEEIAEEIKSAKLFVEVIIAPSFSQEALAILQEKKDIRILRWLNPKLPTKTIKTNFTGLLMQDRDSYVEKENDLKTVTKRAPTEEEKKNLLIAAVAVKHLKSNSIALVKDGALVSMGSGQTARVDALKQALEKAKNFEFDVKGAVMASEAFLPFPDSVEMAGKAGITAVVQPGGSKNDQASIDMADALHMAMVFTGIRHFLH
jgi:phosphoribosylaminoimidazolecarboxamide formyltransferase / IMP cyclohydrolase